MLEKRPITVIEKKNGTIKDITAARLLTEADREAEKESLMTPNSLKENSEANQKKEYVPKNVDPSSQVHTLLNSKREIAAEEKEKDDEEKEEDDEEKKDN